MRTTAIAAVTLALVGLTSTAASADTRAHLPSTANLSKATGKFSFREAALVKSRAKARSAQASIPPNAFRGTYAANGMNVKVAISPGYMPDPLVGQAWANFLTRLPQAGDANSIDVYVAPFSEMSRLCGGEAEACYFPYNQLLISTGLGTVSDGQPIEAVAAHEFAHHIARNRENPPWEAFLYGPKRWATTIGVCPLVRAGKLEAGSDAEDYTLDAAEGWAEAYRMTATQTAWSGLVNSVFNPNDNAKAAVRRDAIDPWERDGTLIRSGRVSRGGYFRDLRIRTPLDGAIGVAVRASKGLDVDLSLWTGNRGQLIDVSARRGQRDGVSGLICGQDSLVVRMYRARGKGSYRIAAVYPVD